MIENLILIRHLKTDAPVQGAFYGSTDLAIEKADYKSFDFSPEKVYTSPMKRCLQTVDIYFPRVSKQTVNDARECDFGEWEGKTFAEIAEGYPAEVEAWKNDEDFAFPSGEKVKNFAKRVNGMAGELISNNEKNLFLVTHAGVIRFLICHFLNISIDKFLSFDVDPGSFTALKVFGQGSGSIHKLNSTGDQSWLKSLL